MARALPTVVSARWTNQDLILYHGTLDIHVASIRGGINLGVAPSYRRLDFGRGFYTTTLEGQARTWARLQARRSTTSGVVRPAVIRFILARDKLASLEAIWFVRGTKRAYDFWSLINYCRGGGVTHGRRVNAGWYDIAIGPVVASLRRRATIPHSDQVSFHTSRAAALLQAGIDRVIVEQGGWRVMP